jgi:hypothetical protein
MKWAILAGTTVALMAGLPALCQSNPKAEQLQFHARQAQEYLKSNQPDLAAREFSAMVALDPNNIDARGNLGVLLFFRGDLRTLPSSFVPQFNFSRRCGRFRLCSACAKSASVKPQMRSSI